MSVPPAQLAILASLTEPKGVSVLASENGLPYEAAYKAVRESEKRGVVATHREGRALVASCRSALAPQLARSLILDYPRQDWGRVFHGQRPTLLRVLDQVGEPELTAEVCGKSRSLVYHAIKTHAPRALLIRKGGTYAVNPRLTVLRSLLEELDRVEAAHRLHEIEPDARIVWSLGPEILFASRKRLASPRAQLAALSRFGEYGIDLIMGEATTYCVTKRRLDAADAILQTLIGPGSSINRSYCALLYEKAKPADFERKSKIYGLEAEARALVRYVQTHEAPEGFLPWREHEEYREQYKLST